MSNPKTTQQIEDAEIADAIRTAVGLELRRVKRHLENKLVRELGPKIAAARLEGREIDTVALARQMLESARQWFGGTA